MMHTEMTGLGPVDFDDLRRSATLIERQMRGHFLHSVRFRYCLELFHRAFARQVPLRSPSLELGIGCGAASWFMWRGGPRMDYGGDMPMGATAESCGLEVDWRFDHFNRLVGLDMSDLPFADGGFATVVSSETMWYGQDLRKTFSEIFRVLAPGGIGAVFVPTDEWLRYPELFHWLRQIVPTAEMHADGFFRDMIVANGGRIIGSRKFFSSVFEASVLLHDVFNEGGFCADHVAKRLGDPVFEAHYRKQLATLYRMVEKELSLPQGPVDGFHDFIVFQKPGRLPDGLAVPPVVCLSCHGSNFRKSVSEWHCQDCGAGYDIRCGVPIMLRHSGVAYSPTQLMQSLPSLHRRFEMRLHQILEPLMADGLSPYVHNGEVTAIPGASEASILAAAIRHFGVEPAGIYAPGAVSGATLHGLPVLGATMRGLPVLGADRATAVGAVGLLVLCERTRREAVTRDLKAQGVTGTVSLVTWQRTEDDHVLEMENLLL